MQLVSRNSNITYWYWMSLSPRSRKHDLSIFTSPFSCLRFSSSSLWMKAVVSGAGPGSDPVTWILVLKVSLELIHINNVVLMEKSRLLPNRYLRPGEGAGSAADRENPSIFPLKVKYYEKEGGFIQKPGNATQQPSLDKDLFSVLSCSNKIFIALKSPFIC